MLPLLAAVLLVVASGLSGVDAQETPVLPPPATGTLPKYLATASAAYTGGPFFALTSLFPSYYAGFEPTQVSVQPQPMVTDPVNGAVFPLELTDPFTPPDVNVVDPYVLPPSPFNPATWAPLPATANLSTPGSLQLAAQTLATILEIANSTEINSSCAKCLAALAVGKMLANTAPWEVPGVLTSLCNYFDYDAYGTCSQEFQVNSDGDVSTQVLALADALSQDGEYICNYVVSSETCAKPAANELNMTGYFATPKPANAVAPPPSGQRIRVLHVSDFHLDPRYANGYEADCAQYMCCRNYSYATTSPNETLYPAPRYGAFYCDTPLDLAGIAIEAIPKLAGAGSTGEEFDFAIFTGDLVSHDNDNQLSRAYDEYEQVIIYSMLKQVIGGVPLYATLGNHDIFPQAYNAPLTLEPEYLATQFSWDYEHVSSLWSYMGWLPADAVQYAAVHYAGYSVTTWRGLKVLSFNTDFWYWDNWFNYINSSNPDPSGQFRWLADELQASEDIGQRVWIIGHIPPGYEQSGAMPNPTNLFYQIVDRYSPHVIAEMFFGHTHRDQLSIFYANNATNASAETALALSWIGPSITPLTNLNSGFRAYDIDPITFNVLDSYTWISNISAAPALDNQTAVGAHYSFEYSAREAYGQNISWPEDAPLNATWWHLVTEQMEINPSLVDLFTLYSTKNSVKTTNCTSAACVATTICYIRSGSWPLGGLCPSD